MLFSKILKSKLPYYLLEAIIIVTSILGAFALDRWNDQRKENTLELELLGEMLENSHTNIASINYDINHFERSQQSIDIILNAFEQNKPYDSTLNEHFARIPLMPRLVITDASYHSMKLTGMRIVKNSSLRNAISNLYEQYYKFVLELNSNEWNTQFEDHRDIYRKKFSDFEFWSELVPVDYEQLKKDETYINYLKNRKGWLKFDIEMYTGRANQTKDLIEAIQQELEARR